MHWAEEGKMLLLLHYLGFMLMYIPGNQVQALIPMIPMCGICVV